VQLNWIYDEYFISGYLKNILSSKISDIEFFPVIKYPTNEYFGDIFQIKISKYIDLEMANAKDFVICSKCNMKKFLPHTKGFFPKPLENNFKIAKSTQYFGSNRSAFNAVIISKELFCVFDEFRIKGISYIPCKK
jgi:hypothetical protein